ncbi:mediator of DNA damage checkpoint protein 1-like [Topomyia yanbarensis]|uniref:mediator of DNA damage checkpoint protein 1-like n=1 Tax=Topomyia yanbarensis TaxID=2498891 RepID=UPI00273BB5DF|nr:mediator of DNA damage checkpoint protein 1-like [Topomyia yanbarensis]XP_058824605.1 mediator of DNA damage checkpoint protein 1-like [Topomyia yanbarensis]
MSHRSSDTNASWNNRSSRNSNDGGGGGGYNERSWSGSRYSLDNRYNKDRRNFRGYGGRSERRPYEERRGGYPYRSTSWVNNSGSDGNYSSHPRHQQNWQKKNTKSTQPIPPPLTDSDEPPSSVSNGDAEKSDLDVSTNGGQNNGDKLAGTSINLKTDDKNDVPAEDNGLPHIDTPKVANGINVQSNEMDSSARMSPTLDDKLEITPHENELIKLIEDEALKMISDAEQPLCSTSQNISQETTAPAIVSSGSAQNPERQATIERSAEQVTRKLINQLTTMNKYSLKQMINNPDSKYETALKTHARQKLRAEVRRQLRNFSLQESTSQTKTCGMLEPDECVDSDKIPDALLEQIGKVLDLNLLDLNVGDDQPQVATVEDEDCVINPSDPDYSATEMLDKNLRLTDDDVQLHLDAEDIFARAELLLMKGSETGISSGPSSPTEEMFPNDQIDSIVSEENGYEKVLETTGTSDAKAEILIEESAQSTFPCFLRVSTVEELNKKVDDLSTPMEVSGCTTNALASPAAPNEPENDYNADVVSEEPALELPSNEHAQMSEIITVTNGQKNCEMEYSDSQKSIGVVQEPVESAMEVTNDTPNAPNIEAELVNNTPNAPNIEAELVNNTPNAPNIEADMVNNTHNTPNIEADMVNDQEEPPKQPQLEVTPPVTPVPLEKPSEIVDDTIQTSIQTPTTEPATAIIRAPTHPELSTRKSKGSKSYKPNLVQHEHTKRESKSSSSLPRPSSSNPASSPSTNNSPSVSKPRRPGPNLAALKQASDAAKHHSSSKNGGNASTTEDNSKSRSAKKREPSTNNSINNTSTISAASPSRNSNRSSPQVELVQTSQPLPTPLKPVAGRARTPGPMSAAAASDSSKQKKKKKRNRRRDFSPDLGMMLECDLRVSRPVVTPTPPPTQIRETPPSSASKKNSEPERETKPFRETRARSVDPKMICDGKRDREREKDRDRDRAKDKAKSRDVEEKRDTERDTRKEKSRDDRREKDRDVKKDKDTNKEKEKEDKKEPESTADVNNDSGKTQSAEQVPKIERERKKSPTPKPKTTTDPIQPPVVVKEAKVTSKHHSEETTVVENPNDVKTELPKEVDMKHGSKASLKGKEIKEAKHRESSTDRDTTEAASEKETKDDSVYKESKEKETKSFKEKGTDEKVAEETSGNEVKKSPKRRKNLLRGPNLIKGRREAPEMVVPNQPEPQNDNKLEAVQEIVNPKQSNAVKDRQETISSEITSAQPTPHKGGRDAAVPDRIVPMPAADLQHPAIRSTATLFVNRTSSPRPWKSPGEKKLLPAGPLLPAPLAPMSPPHVERHIPSAPMSPPHVERHIPSAPMSPPHVERHIPSAPMSPPHTERHIPNPIPTTPPTVVNPESVHIHQVALPVLTQTDIMTRIALPTTLCPLVTPQPNAFAPVMTLLNQMQEIDKKMSNFQQRKMQIDSDIMRLNSEKFQIDQSSMQLQNDRFMVLNALRTALVECELSTLAVIQSVPKLASVSPPTVTNRRRHLEPEAETAPKSKRRKPAEPEPILAPQIPQVTLASGPELSESEEPTAQPGATGNSSERTIRRITKISDNTQILKLFQRRRLVSEKSTEESHSEDSTILQQEKLTPAKRRRTRTITAMDQSGAATSAGGGRLRSESNRLVDLKKSVDPNASKPLPAEQTTVITDPPSTVNAAPSVRFEKDVEVPLNAHKNLLTREVKVVLSKLNVSGHRSSP